MRLNNEVVKYAIMVLTVNLIFNDYPLREKYEFTIWNLYHGARVPMKKIIAWLDLVSSTSSTSKVSNKTYVESVICG